MVIATLSPHYPDKLDVLTNQVGRWEIAGAAKLVFLAVTAADDNSHCKLAAGFKSDEAACEFIEEYQNQEIYSKHNVRFERLNLLEAPSIDALGVLF